MQRPHLLRYTDDELDAMCLEEVDQRILDLLFEHAQRAGVSVAQTVWEFQQAFAQAQALSAARAQLN